MNEIEAATRGWWRPSPGSVYPVLEQLSKDGLVKRMADGRYELSQRAEEQLDFPFGTTSRRAQTVDDMITEMSSYISYFEELSATDRSKVSKQFEKIREMVDRLSRLTKS